VTGNYLLNPILECMGLKLRILKWYAQITTFGPGCFCTGRHFAYRHIFVAVSIKLLLIFKNTVLKKLKDVSRNMACAWSLNASVENVSIYFIYLFPLLFMAEKYSSLRSHKIAQRFLRI
jgi:hypothetical protein